MFFRGAQKSLTLALGLLFSPCGLTAWTQQYTISTIAGGAPPATPATAVSASIGGPGSVATDHAGNVYFASLNCVFKVDSNGTLTRIAGTSTGATRAMAVRQPARNCIIHLAWWWTPRATSSSLTTATTESAR